MSELHAYLSDVRVHSRAAFIREYDHPFLLAKLEDMAPHPENTDDDWVGTTRMTRTIPKTGSFAVLRHNAALYSVYRLAPTDAEVVPSAHTETRSEPKYSVTIGRGDDNNVVLNETAVSKRHARFFCDFRNQWYLVDLNSRNGTTVNGSRLQPERPVQVHFGDPIVLGSLVIMIIGAGALYEIVQAQLPGR